MVLPTSHAEVGIAVLSYDRIRLGVARNGALVTGQFVKARAFKCTPAALENIERIVDILHVNLDEVRHVCFVSTQRALKICFNFYVHRRTTCVQFKLLF